jgi:HemY protein
VALRPWPQGGHGVDDGARLLAAEWALDDRDAPARWRCWPLAARRGAPHAGLRLKLQATRMARSRWTRCTRRACWPTTRRFTPAVAQGLLRSLAIEALDSTHDVQQLRRAVAGQFDPPTGATPVAARAAQRAVQLQAADDARQWLRPFWDRLTAWREDREQVALALVDAAAGIGRTGCRGWKAPQRRPLATKPRWWPPWAWSTPSASCGARRAACWSRPRRAQPAHACPPPAWRALAQLAREEGDEDRAQACERRAAALD